MSLGNFTGYTVLSQSLNRYGYSSSNEFQILTTLKHALNSAVHTLKSPQWQCTGALNLHSSQLQCIFSAALNIPSSPRSVLHCRYPETILNPHSTSMGATLSKWD